MHLNYLLPTNRIDEAISEVKRALELEPLSIPMGANLAGLYLFAGKNDLGLEQARKMIALRTKSYHRKGMARSGVLRERDVCGGDFAFRKLQWRLNRTSSSSNPRICLRQVGTQQRGRGGIEKTR